MTIKLRTDIDPDFHEPRGTLRELQHDAAVAHALVRAIEDMRGCRTPTDGTSMATDIFYRAAEILRDEFGIEDQP